jgi:hypothetical protein
MGEMELTAMTSPRVPHAPTAQELSRHESMIRCVGQWMLRKRATQQRLVSAIEEFWRRRGESDYVCDHTLLSRILNPVTPHVPTARRPKAMKIMQAAMIICSHEDDPNLIAPAMDEDGVWASDEEQAFKTHRARLRYLREQGRPDLFQSLHRLGEFVAVARSMDPAPDEHGESFRTRACENTLMTLAAVIEPGDSLSHLSSRLIAQGIDRDTAVKLEQQQVERIDRMLDAAAPATVNMHGYAGAALLFCGQAERGMQMLLSACERSSDVKLRHDPHWQTLLELLERLLTVGEVNAKRWSRQAAQIALETVRARGRDGHLELLRQGWFAVAAPRVAEHWSDVAPEVLERLTSQPGQGQGQGAVSQGRQAIPVAMPRTRRKALPLKMPLWLLVAMITLAAAAGASAGDDFDSSTAVAIRGREAQGPTPPPPPPTPTTAVAVS